MMRFLRYAPALLLGLRCSLLLAQNTPNLRLLSVLDPTPAAGNPVRYSEVTGCGDLAFLAGWSFDGSARNVYVYEVSDPAAPRQLAVVPSSGSVYDVQMHGRYLYVAAQNQNYIDVFDLLDPAAPVLVQHFEPRSPRISPHTFWVAGNALYIADNFAGGISVFDITDKTNFIRKGVLNNGFGTSHDNTVIRGRLYAAFIFQPAGLWLADVREPFTPRNLATAFYPGAGTHNAWPTEDERYVLTTDEVGTTAHNLKIWDAQTPGSLNLVAEYETRPGAIIHNVYVRGRYAYMSYYCDGIRILDMLDPRRPVAVAAYDLNGNGPCSGYSSTWGIYPFSRYIYASDMNLGLHVFEFDQHPPANLVGHVRDAATGAAIAGACVYLPDEYATTRSTAAGNYELPWFKDGEVRVAAEARGYRGDTLRVNVTASGTTRLDFFLQKSVTTVADRLVKSARRDFVLLPGYPNPFSVTAMAAKGGAIQLTYRLPELAPVRLAVWNALGQRVITLVDQVQNAGEYKVRWNGRDEAGRQLSAGVYYVKLQAGAQVRQRRVTVVK
ncbi:MAG: carboxypeptidase regulatory-like domain-containing protein [candidate division KSB1 bacterium]|nr:carboxypeptidase regulatory-like domain-containing protein [candidate division KSB1 bacterium]MDZ7275769.1 carboxypeptidase regulatory-like domain-containing protein [candidate division KSB1 bacterium]MDZ7284540.1 carboxypeptidase regulatory-like domain-containing protein [candidate division KSB1 bacterium]MDZ7298041.1 carboxypeptidase regulatory-like domain-containing protein [candidate division KSB1 bacterium]MDZ7309086.1 carboxypeptidase regulatory-like domain-containing protein [candidat